VKKNGDKHGGSFTPVQESAFQQRQAKKQRDLHPDEEDASAASQVGVLSA
jgi:hypothetical protein